MHSNYLNSTIGSLEDVDLSTAVLSDLILIALSMFAEINPTHLIIIIFFLSCLSTMSTQNLLRKEGAIIIPLSSFFSFFKRRPLFFLISQLTW